MKPYKSKKEYRESIKKELEEIAWSKQMTVDQLIQAAENYKLGPHEAYDILSKYMALKSLVGDGDLDE